MNPLTPERWQEIDGLFEQALERPSHERNPWLVHACAGDEDLFRAVHGLLERTDEAEAVLGDSVSIYAQSIVSGLKAELEQDPGILPMNGRIGPYRLVREIGHGGMGTVYLAERADAEFEKRVALKLVKRGMDTDEVLLRFRYERQILASLEHPNVARLYDGGATEDGRPYLVMEYIEGEPITRYCDDARLTVEARLRLFAAVCEAVQYAHRNLVVHRDIKPSNILVQADGSVKLLDFGIAKLLDPSAIDEAPRTRPELRLLTPEYASPEQIAGGAVTTATDVYSLGVLLYELLAGLRPGPSGGVQRPSTGSSRGRAATDRGQGVDPASVAERRGTSPGRLCRSLRGDLDTIVMRALAAEPGRRYPSAEQLLTDVRNHLQGLPVVARGDSLGYRSSKFVRRHRAGVAAAALVLLSLVGGLSAALWQADQAARERDHADRERVRAEQVSGFVLSLFEAADPLAENRGDSLRVSDLVDRGAERVRRELAGQPQLQAQMLTTLGRVYSNLGSFGAARSLLDEALSLAGGAAGAEYERARALAGLAEVAERLGEYVVSDTLYRNVLALYASYRWEPEALFVSSVSQRAIAAGMLGRSEEAVAGHEEAIRLVRTLPDERGKMYSAVINNLAVHFAGVGEHARAEPLLREVVEVERELYGPTHPHLAVDFNNLASAIHYQGRHAEAEPYYRQAVEVGRAAYGSDHPTVAQFLENLATLLDDGGRHREAEPFYREALRIQLAALGPSSPRVPVLRRNLALNRHSLGEYEEAEALLREAIRAFRADLGADHLYTGLAMASLGRTLTAAGRPAEARPLLEAALALLEAALPEGHWRVHAVRGEIGAAIAALGDTSGAEPMLLASYDALVELKGEIDYSTVDARRHLHRFYTDRGMRERAATFRPRPR